ncbi:uncharacterized protein YuzE [Thermodesulfitimonas autotrophica]|uniref:Uncharacterized protein YuzE n=1 Tax=Thermodesulfitimonas autotrophica TaxID=1894989 RepID=A0A3N5ADC2_9THEO|nr:DUF2283 domain-containing protein [Thermodesulfitimonas autotrophica]RPF42657.1 uncharacterized protein YuzE [Thermodesulfitimonas autotrophica]
MRFRYDPDADALYIRFKEGVIADTEEISAGVMMDVDEEGNLLGLEILNASKKLGKWPLTVEVEMPGIAKEQVL